MTHAACSGVNSVPQEADPFGFHRGKHFVVEQPILFRDERMRLACDLFEHLLRRILSGPTGADPASTSA